MIDHNNLMIGNLIIQKEIELDEYLTSDPLLVVVDSIYFDAIVPDIYIINGYPCSFYDPILITEEWLTEFDFNYSHTYDEWFENPDGSGFMINRCYETGNWIADSVSISYVHELQNLFKMKRKIDLFLE